MTEIKRYKSPIRIRGNMMAQQLLTDDYLKVRFHDCGLCYRGFWCSWR